MTTEEHIEAAHVAIGQATALREAVSWGLGTIERELKAIGNPDCIRPEVLVIDELLSLLGDQLQAARERLDRALEARPDTQALAA
jgi:hypothetical protein